MIIYIVYLSSLLYRYAYSISSNFKEMELAFQQLL